MSTYTGALKPGNHVWLAMEGEKYTPEGGTETTVGPESKPVFSTEEGSPWVKLVSVIGVDPQPEEEEIEASKPNAFGVIEVFDSEIISSKFKYTFDLESYDKAIHEIQFRTKVDSSDKSFVRGSKPSQRGWLHWQVVNKYGEVVRVAEEFCSFKITAGKWDGKNYINPTLEATTLASTQQAGLFDPSGLATPTP